MATTPNVNPDINNEFDMPDEFNVPTLEPSPHDVYNPPHSEGGALTLEDLEEIGVNEQQDEAERKKLYPPPGDRALAASADGPPGPRQGGEVARRYRPCSECRQG